MESRNFSRNFYFEVFGKITRSADWFPVNKSHNDAVFELSNNVVDRIFGCEEFLVEKFPFSIDDSETGRAVYSDNKGIMR